MHRRSSSCDNVRPMTPHRAVLRLVLIAMVLVIASEARAQYPMPRVRERPEAIDAAFRFFEEARWAEAVEAFELAAREAPGALSAEALRRWGVAASEAGRPLAAYVRLGQYLASKPLGADRESAIERVGRARATLLLDAARFSRLVDHGRAPIRAGLGLGALSGARGRPRRGRLARGPEQPRAAREPDVAPSRGDSRGAVSRPVAPHAGDAGPGRRGPATGRRSH